MNNNITEKLSLIIHNKMINNSFRCNNKTYYAIDIRKKDY